MGTRVKNLAMALPSAAVITRRSSSRRPDRKTSSSPSRNRSQPVHSFALEEVNLDFQILGQPRTARGCGILIAASRKEKVDDRVAVAESVGSQAVVMISTPLPPRTRSN